MIYTTIYIPRITAKEGGGPPPIWRGPNLPTFETNALHFGARMAKNRPPPNAPLPFFCCNLGYIHVRITFRFLKKYTKFDVWVYGEHRK